VTAVTLQHALTLPAVPLKDTVLFPYVVMPLSLGRTGSLAALESALEREDKRLAVFAQRDGRVEAPGLDDLHPVGTVAIIRRVLRVDDSVHVVVQGSERVELVGAAHERPYLRVRAQLLAEPADRDTEVEAVQREVMDLARRLVRRVAPETRASLEQVLAERENTMEQVYLLASLLPLDLEQEQRLLEANSVREALRLLHDHVHHEVQVQELRERIARQAESELSREQREYVLRKEMRAIQGELGEASPEQADAAELRQRLEQVELPEQARKEVEKELSRLERMPTVAPDYQITRSYVELILDLPWYATTEDALDLDRAQQVLDEDHYDLDEVKARIVEHLAVMKLNPEAKAPILCFVGPPGVGKTSVGQSIARALGRKFERMSLGGLHDEAELRGHRRTYIGALPGRIVRAIRRAGVKNPLLMLDEVDKLGRDFRGDPAAALMEVLDPEQNGEFHDNYLDLPFDLSRVFFITTANTLDTVPRPLLDRMEVLRLAGYSTEEKQAIARQYLIGRQRTQAGLSEAQLGLPDETVLRIIGRYTREAGVRELERCIGRIARKRAMRVARGEEAPHTVAPEGLADLLGPEHFYAEQARAELPPGVAAGLAWTEAGGDVLYVEAALLPEGKELLLTGQLGEVMQESAKAAKSYIWSRAEHLDIDPETLRSNGVHIHVPAGATPKDGPSAGVTMAVALASLYRNAAARADTAMTGEITLSGLVLPVGGIKEKVLAAHRAGILRVILPAENRKDLPEVPEHVRQAMELVYAERIEDVLAAALGE
jgi:ATP-dependent Lon protease